MISSITQRAMLGWIFMAIVTGLKSASIEQCVVCCCAAVRGGKACQGRRVLCDGSTGKTISRAGVRRRCRACGTHGCTNEWRALYACREWFRCVGVIYTMMVLAMVLLILGILEAMTMIKSPEIDTTSVSYVSSSSGALSPDEPPTAPCPMSC